MSQKTINECKLNIEEFANKHNLIFEEEGECGFGRECVGLLYGLNYVAYNPTDSINYDYIEEFYDERFCDITPSDAYHKYDCLAVLGRGDIAIRQLSDWIDELNKIGVKVDKYETGATGIRAIFSGEFGMAIRVDMNK
jgi:aminoglycoside phosphotransferase family enzyme